MAFLTVAYLDTMGKSITMSDLRELVGEDNEGQPILGNSVERTLNSFLEPTKRDPEALGWLTHENDADDRRRKYLRLTLEGQEAATRFIEAYQGRALKE
ncbi:hypothetical protein DMC25_27035 [Caulobacter sp. D4A]|nr:hypothetical protein DMC25_27035 [Caulobacter sp. D4A]PXA96820.1 hypothetical protein DMC18_00730 [Caulobacter sp. D5]